MNLNDVILNDTVESINSEPVGLAAAAYLLSATVSGLGSQRVEPAISEVCLYMYVLESLNLSIIMSR